MMRLYPPVKVARQSFKGVKVHTVPNQSLTLKQIILRFIRREPLPMLQDGEYNDQHDVDLEKIAKADPVEIDEFIAANKVRVEGLKQKVDKANKSAMERAKASKAAEESRLFAEWEAKQKDPQSVSQQL